MTDDLLRLAHAYHHDELDDTQAAALAEALRRDSAGAGQALALDGHLAVALGGDRTHALLARLREHWPKAAARSARHARRVRRIATDGKAWLAVAALLLAVAGAWWWSNLHDTAPALIASSDGEAALIHDGRSISLAEASGLAAGDRLTVPEGVTATISARNEASTMVLHGPADLTVVATTPGKRLALRRGRFTASLAPQPAGHPLLVSCPFTEITVVGTRFSITADATGDRIAVAHGTVRVADPGSSTTMLVSAGEVVAAGADRPLAKVVPASAREVGTSWFDFSRIDGTAVANRLDPDHPGTLIDLGVAPGRDGQALHLPGMNERFVFATSRTPDMTAALWIKRAVQPTHHDAALLMLPRLQLYLGAENSPLNLCTRIGKPIAGWSTNPEALRLGIWQHVAVTIAVATDGVVTPTLFIDGQAQQLWTWSGDWHQAPPDLDRGTIGIESSAQRSIAGLVDDLRLWPRVLAPAEIAAIAQQR